MKKRVIALVAAGLAVMGMLAGCGGKKEMNVDEVANRLLSEITYQDELCKMDLDTAGMILNLADLDIKNAAIYETSGWTAEEIVVLQLGSSEDAAKAKAMLATRVEEQKTNYVDYVPEEMDKLNVAVIEQIGDFAVLSVSNEPDKAKKILSEYQ